MLISGFSIIKPPMEGKSTEINKDIKTSKRFHLKPSHTDWFPPTRQNLEADANIDSYFSEILWKLNSFTE